MTTKVQPNMRPLLARDREEAHRSATQLELLFDLVFVVAIAAAAHGLRHEGRPHPGRYPQVRHGLLLHLVAVEPVHLVRHQFRQ